MGPEVRQNPGVDPGPFLSISTRLDMSIKCSAWCSASLKAAHAKKVQVRAFQNIAQIYSFIYPDIHIDCFFNPYKV